MTDGDEAENLRDRMDDDRKGARTPSPTEAGVTAIVVQTKAVGTYPTVAGRFFACDVVDVFGPEGEGLAATYWPKTGTVLVYNLGATVPPVGTKEIARYVPHRWVMRH